MSEWYVSDARGRALAALSAGLDVDPSELEGFDLATLAHSHGLSVSLERVARDPGLRRFLSAVIARLMVREACIDEHMRRLLHLFADGGVPASIVKGPALKHVYRDPSVRTYTDLDFVVPSSHVPQALEILRSYEHIGSIPAKVPEADKRDIVVRDPSGIQFTVDLHWDLFGFHQLGGAAAGAMGEAWARSKFEADNPLGPIWVLPQEAVVSFLTLHAILDHRFRLILFRDLLEVQQTQPDWDAMSDFSRRHGFSALHRLSWSIASEVVGARPPAGFLESLSKGGLPGRVAQWQLGRVDLVRFDGHRVHPLNLSLMLVADEASRRRRLLWRAPRAFPGWRRRVQGSSQAERRSIDVLVSSDARRGAEVFGGTLTEHLMNRGWATSLISLKGGSRPRVPATPVSDASDVRGLRPKVVIGLIRRLRSARPRVVFANGGATLRYAVIAHFFLRPRPRLIYGSIGEPSFWLRGPLHRFFQKLLTRWCSHVVAVSEATARELVEDLGVPKSKVSVVRPGIDDRWLRVSRSAPAAGPMRILFAGSLSYEKNPLMAVEVVKALDADARLRVVGDGPLRAELQASNEPWLEVLGSVENMADQMQWADVLLLTSLTEGLPGVAVEASAAGIPIVAADVGGTGEIVEHGRTGFLVPPGDVDAFTAALRKLSDDPDLRVELGARAHDRAMERFRIGDTLDAYERILERVVGR